VSERAQGQGGGTALFAGWRCLAECHPHRRFQSALAVFACLLLVTGAPSAWAEVFQGKVIGVADGDTITVLRERQPEIVRLNGIDSPEKGQAFGDRAKQFTADLAFGQMVQVIVRDHDRYGRTVADVVLADGRSLNHEVVRGGYAWWFRRYSKDATLGALESEARSARRGLWADAHPVAPWEWRQTQNLQITAPSPVPLVSPAPVETSRASVANGSVVGNRRSRIYHRPDCPDYGAVASQNRVPFGSAAEAESAGYRLARNCP
jgi:endonuclease YncB( thermonuclease family)